MTMNPNDPDYRREAMREIDEEGMSTATWAGIAFAVMVIGGVVMYAFSSKESTTASGTQPGFEQSLPPATTGRGGAQSRIPTPKQKAE